MIARQQGQAEAHRARGRHPVALRLEALEPGLGAVHLRPRPCTSGSGLPRRRAIASDRPRLRRFGVQIEAVHGGAQLADGPAEPLAVLLGEFGKLGGDDGARRGRSRRRASRQHQGPSASREATPALSGRSRRREACAVLRGGGDAHHPRSRSAFDVTVGQAGQGDHPPSRGTSRTFELLAPVERRLRAAAPPSRLQTDICSCPRC